MSNLIQAYLDELEVEAGRTQKVLEAVPADKLDWRPASDKAMTLGNWPFTRRARRASR